MQVDVFNGDADGIIALVQLRLAQPQASTLITGVKRDINLLAKVIEQCDLDKITQLTVLDISLEKNRSALQQILTHNSVSSPDVFYVDHHRCGAPLVHPRLTKLIDTDANICTSLLVNQHLADKYIYWAIAAAFGDNLFGSAQRLAKQQQLTEKETSLLAELGTYINYNGYGRTVDDLHYHPAQLYKLLVNYENPLLLLQEKNSLFTQLKSAYQQDMSNALSAEITFENAYCKIITLEDAAWARRVSGVFGNYLANQSPDKAHAIFTYNSDSSYTVSVRAPLHNKQGADVLCAQFPTGGGRTAAAGINQLAQKDVASFIRSMSKYYSQ
jgi:hypothetical protein